ncbi:MAG: primosomal protein N' [Gammaproteobacteria bacterium]|nr:primosomal protein N' [Gammaproteobacteria bacterium]
MPHARPVILRVALPVPLRRGFEYFAPPAMTRPPGPGTRIHVPFGKSRWRIGIVLGNSMRSELPSGRLKTAGAIIDDEPLFSADHFRLLLWASEYYQHPIGEVLFGALPGALRKGKTVELKSDRVWRLSRAGQSQADGGTRLGPKQAALLSLLQQSADGILEGEMRLHHEIGRATLKSLQAKGRIESAPAPGPVEAPRPVSAQVALNAAQARAAGQIAAELGRFQPFLLNGVTGSGKTEVYLNLINTVAGSGSQALVLVPEIGLTPQLVERIRARIGSRVALMHSSLSESERLASWLQARAGQADVLLGTRSAVWTPLRKPGIFIIDEEHDSSFKQQDGFRYSARDVAIMRARDAGVPIVLGSATPSMESLHNARTGKYTELRLPQRAGDALPPEIRIVDLRHQRLDGAISLPLIQAIDRELAARRQVLIFLNRRGYSPVILCHACGWMATCKRCNVPLTWHKRADRFLCHHCALQSRLPLRCPECGAGELLEVGHGTERLAETLSRRFPEARVLRIDRDSTRRKGVMNRMVESIATGDADILIGTQMLAKGHDFPNLTLVGIVDADRGLYSTDYRSGERMAQLFMQVSGRAGRAEHRGTVMIQTHHPDHPLLRSLIEHGYGGFADAVLRERRDAQLPPYSYLALLRAEHYRPETPQRFLDAARGMLEQRAGGLQIFGPVPAPMEKRAGRHRFQLLVQGNSRAALHKALRSWTQELEDIPGARQVRWSLDVDPVDLS